MISDRALALAVTRALITPDQAEALRATERECHLDSSDASDRVEPADDEALRLVTGFADIFVTLGIVLFLTALGYLMDNGAGSTPMFAGIAASSWLLAEFFTGKRRMALPSIVLLVVFVGSTFLISLQIFESLVPGGHAMPALLRLIPSAEVLPVACAALVATGMAVLHYVRFRVPITVAAGAASLSILFMALVAAVVPSIDERVVNVTLFVCGLAIFALAMRFDMSDPARRTRRTDIAFWLHLLAAPLIVHPLINGFLHGLDAKMTTGAALGILWVFLVLGVVAVIIDRRAILVSGLVYAGIAFGTLIKQLGFSGSTLILPNVLLALGAFILLLSAGWLPLRRAILRRLPVALAQRLPHPLTQARTQT